MTNLVLSILAQTPNNQTPSTPQPGGGMTVFFALAMAMIVFIFMTERSKRKREERARQALLRAISKNDRVLTVGGIIGTVMSVRDDEVVLKVDESTNTKMTFAKTAVQRVLGDEAADKRS